MGWMTRAGSIPLLSLLGALLRQGIDDAGAQPGLGGSIGMHYQRLPSSRRICVNRSPARNEA